MDVRNVLIALLIGLIAGWLASFIVGGHGVLRYILTGVIGAFFWIIPAEPPRYFTGNSQ